MSFIEIIKGKDFTPDNLESEGADEELRIGVAEILRQVRAGGDRAVMDLTRRFDGVELEKMRVDPNDIKAAEQAIDPDLRQIFQNAIDNIRRFHEEQIAQSWEMKLEDGTRLGEKVTPLDRVGLYVPGGTAFYPSTIMMNCVPAQLAGVPSIMAVSPPGKDGRPNRMVLAVCRLLGLEEIYAIGGAQSIGAMAYGTESMDPVCKITGPGNRYVAEAKRQVFGRVGIDSIAGPSEILILHDGLDVPEKYLARDLLSQAEHDPNARSVLVTTSEQTARETQKVLDEIVPNLPRSEIIKQSLSANGAIVLVDEIAEGIEIANKVAPEHLEVLLSDHRLIEKIRNAGAIFIGPWSPEPVGDYFAGPNHTIPTGGAARYGSPLSVRDFQKHSSVIEYSKARLMSEGEKIARFADLEELPAHAASVRARLEGEGS